MFLFVSFPEDRNTWATAFSLPSPALLCKNSRKQREQTQCEKTLGELLRNRPRRRFPSLNQSRVWCCTCVVRCTRVSSLRNKRESEGGGGHTPVFRRGEKGEAERQSLVIIIHYTLLIAERPHISLSLSFTSTYTVYSALTRSILFKGGSEREREIGTEETHARTHAPHPTVCLLAYY